MKLLTSAFVVLTMMSTAHAAAETTPIQTKSGTIGAAPPGMGQVVFFRTSAMGALLGCTVREGNEEIARLGVGKYYVVPTAPGMHVYNTKSLESRDQLRLEVEEGETYFVKCSISMGFMSGKAKLAPADLSQFAKSAAGLNLWNNPKNAINAATSTGNAK